MRFSASVASLLTVVVTQVAFAVPSAAAATTEIGAVAEVRAATAPSAIAGGGYTVQASEGTGTYAVPVGYATITSWSHSAGGVAGSLTFKVYRPTGTRQEYTVVASDARSVTAGSVQTFPVSLPVRPGDRIGLSSETVQLAFESGSAADRIGFFGADPMNGMTDATDGDPFPEFKLDVSATLASDAGPDPAGGTPPPGPSGGQTPAADRPTLSNLAVVPRAFSPARSGPSVRTAGLSGTTKVSYRVDLAGKVRFTVQRMRPGRRHGTGAGARCVAQTRLNRTAAACTRRIPLAGAFTRTVAAGRDSFRFSGRLGNSRLTSGVYRLVATPSAATKRGKQVGRIFQILR